MRQLVTIMGLATKCNLYISYAVCDCVTIMHGDVQSNDTACMVMYSPMTLHAW